MLNEFKTLQAGAETVLLEVGEVLFDFQRGEKQECLITLAQTIRDLETLLQQTKRLHSVIEGME